MSDIVRGLTLTASESPPETVESLEAEARSMEGQDVLTEPKASGLAGFAKKLKFEHYVGAAGIIGTIVAIFGLFWRPSSPEVSPPAVVTMSDPIEELRALREVLEVARDSTSEIGQSFALEELTRVLISFGRMDISNQVFIGTTTNQATIHESDLSETQFLLSDLSSTIVDSSKLDGAAFVLSDLSNAKITVLEGDQVTVSGGTLEEASLVLEANAELRISGASLVGAQIAMDRGSRLNVDRTDLSQARVYVYGDLENEENEYAMVAATPEMEDPEETSVIVSAASAPTMSLDGDASDMSASELDPLIADKDLDVSIASSNQKSNRFHQTLLIGTEHEVFPTQEGVCLILDERCSVDLGFEIAPESFIPKLAITRKYEAVFGDPTDEVRSVLWETVNGSSEYRLRPGRVFDLPRIIRQGSKDIVKRHVESALKRYEEIWRAQTRFSQSAPDGLRRDIAFNAPNSEEASMLDVYLDKSRQREARSVSFEALGEASDDLSEFRAQLNAVSAASSISGALYANAEEDLNIEAAVIQAYSVCADPQDVSSAHLSQWDKIGNYANESAIATWVTSLEEEGRGPIFGPGACRLPDWEEDAVAVASVDIEAMVMTVPEVNFEATGGLVLELDYPLQNFMEFRLLLLARRYGEDIQLGRSRDATQEVEAGFSEGRLSSIFPSQTNSILIGNLESIFEAARVCDYVVGSSNYCRIESADRNQSGLYENVDVELLNIIFEREVALIDARNSVVEAAAEDVAMVTAEDVLDAAAAAVEAASDEVEE